MKRLRVFISEYKAVIVTIFFYLLGAGNISFGIFFNVERWVKVLGGVILFSAFLWILISILAIKTNKRIGLFRKYINKKDF